MQRNSPGAACDGGPVVLRPVGAAPCNVSRSIDCLIHRRAYLVLLMIILHTQECLSSFDNCNTLQVDHYGGCAIMWRCAISARVDILSWVVEECLQSGLVIMNGS